MKTENYFTCPHCEVKYKDVQDYGFENIDEEVLFAMDCEHCDNEFEVRFKTVIYFDTRKYYTE